MPKMLLHFLMFCRMISLCISHTDLLCFLIVYTMISAWLLDILNPFIMPEMYFLVFCHMLPLFISHIVGSHFFNCRDNDKCLVEYYPALFCDFLYSHVMFVYTIHVRIHWSCFLYMFDNNMRMFPIMCCFEIPI